MRRFVVYEAFLLHVIPFKYQFDNEICARVFCAFCPGNSFSVIAILFCGFVKLFSVLSVMQSVFLSSTDLFSESLVRGQGGTP